MSSTLSLAVFLGWGFWTIGKLGAVYQMAPPLLAVLCEGVARALPGAHERVHVSPRFREG